MKAELKELLAKLTNTPLVVETGTSGMWTYRKWSDGTAECWGKKVITLSHYATVFGGYGYYTSVEFPTGLFAEAPLPTYSAYINNGFALTGTQTISLSTTSTNVYAVASSSGSNSTTWYMRVVGKWK